LEPSNEEITQALERFADAFIQNLQDSQEQSSEAFEAYELALKTSIHSNSQQFKKRFVRGYFSLVNL